MKVIKCDRCGEICSIGRGVTFTHNNGSTADFCPDCYENFKKWLKREEQEKPRMTCREWLVKNYPRSVAEEYGGKLKTRPDGGCVGCPNTYCELDAAKDYCADTNLYDAAECEKCWSQPVPEGVE